MKEVLRKREKREREREREFEILFMNFTNEPKVLYMNVTCVTPFTLTCMCVSVCVCTYI